MIIGVGGMPLWDGTPGWAVVMTTSEIGEIGASVTFSTQVLVVARSEREARDVVWDLAPFVPAEASVSIQETEMIDSD